MIYRCYQVVIYYLCILLLIEYHLFIFLFLAKHNYMMNSPMTWKIIIYFQYIFHMVVDLPIIVYVKNVYLKLVPICYLHGGEKDSIFNQICNSYISPTWIFKHTSTSTLNNLFILIMKAVLDCFVLLHDTSRHTASEKNWIVKKGLFALAQGTWKYLSGAGRLCMVIF